MKVNEVIWLIIYDMHVWETWFKKHGLIFSFVKICLYFPYVCVCLFFKDRID